MRSSASNIRTVMEVKLFFHNRWSFADDRLLTSDVLIYDVTSLVIFHFRLLVHHLDGVDFCRTSSSVKLQSPQSRFWLAVSAPQKCGLCIPAYIDMWLTATWQKIETNVVQLWGGDWRSIMLDFWLLGLRNDVIFGAVDSLMEMRVIIELMVVSWQM